MALPARFSGMGIGGMAERRPNPKWARNRFALVEFARRLRSCIMWLCASMVLLHFPRQPGSQLLQGVFAMAQTQLRCEHVEVDEHGQHGSSRAGAVFCLLLLVRTGGWGVASSSSASSSDNKASRRDIFDDLDAAAPAANVKTLDSASLFCCCGAPCCCVSNLSG
jgi:hypothetical protein